MKTDISKIAMYIAIGALLTVIILQVMGRLKTESYEGGNSDETGAELEKLLAELEGDTNEGGDDEMAPTPMGEDSDDEM
jgi:hypothetical protein